MVCDPGVRTVLSRRPQAGDPRAAPRACHLLSSSLSPRPSLFRALCARSVSARSASSRSAPSAVDANGVHAQIRRPLSRSPTCIRASRSGSRLHELYPAFRGCIRAAGDSVGMTSRCFGAPAHRSRGIPVVSASQPTRHLRFPLRPRVSGLVTYDSRCIRGTDGLYPHVSRLGGVNLLLFPEFDD
jgi:hypothetical protein